MENMLKKIIEADKKARESVENAEAQRKEVEEKIAEAKAQFAKKYSEEAAEKSRLMKEVKEAMIQKEKDDYLVREKEQIEILESICSEKKEAWIEAIVRRVTEA